MIGRTLIVLVLAAACGRQSAPVERTRQEMAPADTTCRMIGDNHVCIDVVPPGGGRSSRTAGCGTYYADDVLASIVVPLLTDDDERGRSLLGLVAQPDTIRGRVETRRSVCAPLVQYFIDNLATFYSDTSHLLAHGWSHAVMQLGDYQILLIDPLAAYGQVGSPLSSLLFFDRQGQFVSAFGTELP